MSDNAAAVIAARAVSQIGVRFKLHGRLAGHALDCAGLTAYAIQPFGNGVIVPQDYFLRGDFEEKIETYLDNSNCIRLPPETQILCGDILLLQVAASQQHLAIMSEKGIVHAHAGLRKVVLTPLPLPWQLRAIWRIKEN